MSSNAQEPAKPAKKEYQKPTLRVYGDLRSVTATTGNTPVVPDVGLHALKTT